VGFEHNKHLEIYHARTIKQILGVQFFKKNEFADAHEGTDFGIFTAEPIRCAVRLRRYRWYCECPEDVTIRCWLPSGFPTEIHKIQRGLVNHMLYGFVNDDETRIVAYGILRLPFPFTLEPYRIFPNNPRDSDLAVFKRRQFPILRIFDEADFFLCDAQP
jgi:hypothetical protein